MRQSRTAACAAFVAALACAFGVRAEESKVDGAIDEAKEYVNKFVDINAMVATTYTWASNNPESGLLPYLPINKDNNTFSLYDGWFQLSRNREDEDFGFTFNMDFGQTAQNAGADWNGDGAVESDFVYVREFYGTWKTPLAGIKIKAGKFVSLLGYEVLMTNTAFNPTVTLSYLFMNVPYTNTGIMAHAPLGDMVTLDVGVVNGWDNVVDNNNQKSFTVGLGVIPMENLTTYLAGIYGSELCGQSMSNKCQALPHAGAGSKRGAVTWNASYTLPEETGLGLTLDTLYANESNALPDPTTGQPFSKSASWYGAAGYLLWAVPLEQVKGLGFNLRAEVIADPDGYRNPTGTTNPAVVGTPQTIWEMSPTIYYQVNDHILTRLEYRYDHSNKAAFQKDSGYSTFANTLTGEIIVAF